MIKTITSYDKMMNGELELEKVNYDTFCEIIDGWEIELDNMGGSIAIIVDSLIKQKDILEISNEHKNLKSNIDRWLNEYIYI